MPALGLHIRWQIPTFVGAGFSAQAHVSGDVDGIFGGSPDTYVRDLQFKCLMTTMMTMSGWAGNPDKQVRVLWACCGWCAVGVLWVCCGRWIGNPDKQVRGL